MEDPSWIVEQYSSLDFGDVSGATANALRHRPVVEADLEGRRLRAAGRAVNAARDRRRAVRHLSPCGEGGPPDPGNVPW